MVPLKGQNYRNKIINFTHYIDYTDCNKLLPNYIYIQIIRIYRSRQINLKKNFLFFFFSWTNELNFGKLNRLCGSSKEEGHIIN